MIQEARRWTASILFSLEPGSALTTCSWLLTSWLHTRLQHPRLSSRKGEISGSHQKPGLLLNLLDSENNWPAFTSYSPTMVNSKGIYQTRYSHKALKKKKKKKACRNHTFIHMYSFQLKRPKRSQFIQGFCTALPSRLSATALALPSLTLFSHIIY